MREKATAAATEDPYKYLPVTEEREVARLRAELARPIPAALCNVWPEQPDRNRNGEVIPLSDVTRKHLEAEELRLKKRVIVRVRRNDSLIADKRYQGLTLQPNCVNVEVPLDTWIAAAPSVVEVIERSYVSVAAKRYVKDQTVDSQDLGYRYEFPPIPEFIVEHWDASTGTIRPSKDGIKAA